MNSNKLNVYIFNLLLLLFPALLIANDLNDMLLEAEEIKSNNPVKFSSLLETLNTKLNSLSKQQANHLKYLNAYEIAFAGDTTKAIAILKDIINSDATQLIKYRSRLSIINFHGYDRNWADGLSNLKVLLEELPKINNEQYQKDGLALAAMFYNQIGQYSLGLTYANQLENQTKDARQNCLAKMFKFESIFYTTDLKVNPIEINSAIKACNSEPIAANLLRTYVAEMHIEDEQFESANTLLLKHVHEVESAKYVRLIVRFYSLIAETYFKQSDFERSSLYSKKTIEKAINIPTTQGVINAYKFLYQIAKEQKDFPTSLLAHEKYSQLNQLHTDEITAKHFAYQLAEHKSLEQQSKISLLNEKNTLLETKQALSKAEVANTRLIVMVLIISLLLFTFWGGRLYKAHKRIKELAEFDALTGIFNRGHFTHVATSALSYCKSAKQDLSVIMFDLDHFKSINDMYGHATGDWALKETIKVCQNVGRKNDVFARLGGEEFCILLPSCHIRSAALVAEHCRSAIEDIVTEASGHDFKITASFGITDAKTSGFELEKLLADADEAAYDSKKSGRNRITVFTINEEPEQKQLDNSWSIS
ncbi:GGDEF domain-containing protein [Colwellia sp. RSH04]|uniref:GGDEF domain-containing protein n=1 Tax=Colwellia sp. RSH04 TaxID=2305464 RepID=UPI000E57251F|nr:GGDEF domain-containing protein [Colwellia sp. RSH04]RHW77870.1 GGDEF domain-containing protein [Colwellia sp. RSH04]